MRSVDRPYITANDSPRRFSDVKGESAEHDLRARQLAEMARLEAEAVVADPAERQRLQCEAEALRIGNDGDGQRRSTTANLGGRQIATRRE